MFPNPQLHMELTRARQNELRANERHLFVRAELARTRKARRRRLWRRPKAAFAPSARPQPELL